MLKGLYGPLILTTFRRRQVDQIGSMRADGLYPTLFSCNIEPFNIVGRQPSLLPGDGIFSEYLQSTASVLGCSEDGLMQTACYRKMGAKEDDVWKRYTCVFGQKEYPHNPCRMARSTPMLQNR